MPQHARMKAFLLVFLCCCSLWGATWADEPGAFPVNAQLGARSCHSSSALTARPHSRTLNQLESESRSRRSTSKKAFSDLLCLAGSCQMDLGSSLSPLFVLIYWLFPTPPMCRSGKCERRRRSPELPLGFFMLKSP